MLTTIQENVTVGRDGLIQLHVPGFEYNSRLSVVAVIEQEKELPDNEFWMNASQSSIDEVWNNDEDNVYEELLNV